MILGAVASLLVVGGGLWAGQRALDGWGIPAIVRRRGPEPALEKASPPPPVAETLEVSREGARTRAWIVEPAGEVPRGTVFLLHGIGDDKTGLVDWGARFAAGGWRAVLVDARGHGESTGDWITYGVEESRDLVSVADALADRRRLARPLAVVGVSYGGSTAIQWAARDPRVAAVVAVAAFASFEDVLRATVRRALGPAAGWVPEARIRHVLALAGSVAGFDPDEASAVAAAAALGRPLLLIHGTADEKVPASHAHRLEAAAGPDATLYLVPGAGHAGLWQRPDVRARVDRWLAEPEE